jgi:hypothetical protein
MTLSQIEISEELERALRDKAAAEHKSVDAVVVDVLSDCLGVKPRQSTKPRDLSFLTTGVPLEPEVIRALEEQRQIKLTDVVGTWESDPNTEAILEEQNRIDPEMWK